MFEPKQYASIYCKISLIHVVVGQKRAGTTTIIVAVLWICKVQRSLQPKRLKSHRNYVVKNEICLKMSFSQSTVWRWCQTSSVKQPYQESKSNSLLRLGNNQIMFCFLVNQLDKSGLCRTFYRLWMVSTRTLCLWILVIYFKWVRTLEFQWKLEGVNHGFCG